MRLRMPLTLVAAAMLAAPLVLMPGAAGQPVGCGSVDAVGLTMGAAVACLAADGAVPPLSPDGFRPLPGVSYATAYGPEPAEPSRPPDCDTAPVGTWTEDAGSVRKVRRDGERTVYEVTKTFDWVSGAAIGRSVSNGELWRAPDGTIVYVSRELFEGTVAGRTGSFVLYNKAHLAADGEYVGRGFVVGGTEGLSAIRADAAYVGRAGAGGRYGPPSHACFVS